MHDFDKLELSTETIRDLTGEELREVAGGAPPNPLDSALCLTGYYPSINARCDSIYICTGG